MKKLCFLIAVLTLLCAVAVPAMAAQEAAPVYIAGNTYYDPTGNVFLYYADAASSQVVRSSAADGMITEQAVSVKADAGTALEVYRNGARLDSISEGVFRDPGEYVVMYMGGAVSERIFSFTIVPEQCNYVTGYTLPAGFEMVNATLNEEPVAFDRNYIKLADEGEYNIQYQCIKTSVPYELRVRTDFTGPVLSLEEVIDGVARGPVDISEAMNAAVVNIYHDGEKITRKDVLTQSGEYYIELADEAGNKTTYSFTILIYFDGNSWLFFFLVLFAALTSSISLMETIVSILMDKLGWNRLFATVSTMVFVLIAGIPSSLGFGIWSHITPLGMDLLDFFDFVSNTVMMPIVSFLICFLAAYILKPDTIIKEAEANGASFKSEKFYRIMIRYVAPIGIIAIWVSSMAAGLGLFSW